MKLYNVPSQYLPSPSLLVAEYPFFQSHDAILNPVEGNAALSGSSALKQTY